MNRFQAQNKRERIFSPRKNYRRGKKLSMMKKTAQIFKFNTTQQAAATRKQRKKQHITSNC